MYKNVVVSFNSILITFNWLNITTEHKIWNTKEFYSSIDLSTDSCVIF